MVTQEIVNLPILPQGMKTEKPTWSNIKFCFNSTIMLSFLLEKEGDWQHKIKGVGKKQCQILKLLGVKEEKYQEMTPNWWLDITDRGG